MKLKEDSILNKKININITLIYLLISVILTIPSIIYLVKNKTIYNFIYVFSYSFTKADTVIQNYFNGAIYLLLFLGLFYCYFYILKNREKIFKNNKNFFIFIIIIGILFSIIIPTTSLDVYSYIGNGWVDSNYSQNPYYTSVQDIVNENGPDEMLGKVARCWRNEPVVYGPVWSLICKILTSFSFGNITIALYIFKLVSFLIFLGCSLLIYKITKKKLFTLMFALNPFILFEFLSNVHNDIFLVFFVLLAIYFIKNRKNVFLAVSCIAIATGIKYLTILLLPFIIIYALRKENLKNKIIKTLIYGIEFIVIIFAFYLLYIKDFQVLSGIFVQQNKYGRSIFLAIYFFLNGDEKALSIIKAITMIVFAISYITIILKMFLNKNSKNIKFMKSIRIYQIFLLIFTFILITNFNPWYVIWLFPTLFYQKAKNIKLTLYLSLGALVSYTITYVTGIDDETVGIPYLITMFGTVIICYCFDKVKNKLKEV